MSLLATLSFAAPTPQETPTDVFHEVGLRCVFETPASPVTGDPIPGQLNTLIETPGMTCYEIEFDGSSANVDINSVECRAYKDADGVIPGSAPFTLASPALLSTPGNEVEINSLLCYVVGE